MQQCENLLLALLSSLYPSLYIKKYKHGEKTTWSVRLWKTSHFDSLTNDHLMVITSCSHLITHLLTHTHTGIPAHIHTLAWYKLNSKDELHLKRARNKNNNVCVTTFKITFKLYRTRILIVCKCFRLYVRMTIVGGLAVWLAGWTS